MSDMLRDGLREGVAEGRIELNGVDVIAESERHGEPRSLFWPWCAANVAVLAVSWGGYVLGMGINLAQGLLVTLFGVIASFLLVGLASLAGQKGSAPTLVLSRASFGIRGNLLPGARVLVPADRLGDRAVLAGRAGQPDRGRQAVRRLRSGGRGGRARGGGRLRHLLRRTWLRRDHEGPAVADPRDARAHARLHRAHARRGAPGRGVRRARRQHDRRDRRVGDARGRVRGGLDQLRRRLLPLPASRRVPVRHRRLDDVRRGAARAASRRLRPAALCLRRGPDRRVLRPTRSAR